MKTKLMTFLSLSMLLASCAQDESRDNVMPVEKQVAANGSKTSGIASRSTVALIKEVYHPSILNAGQAITLENNGQKFQLIMQYDHNLVLYRTIAGYTYPLWKSDSYRNNLSSPSTLVAQNDGNMVIYNNGIPLWNTNKTAGFYVNDPHMKLQLFSKTGAAIPTGYRMKFVLGGNNLNINDVFEIDFD